MADVYCIGNGEVFLCYESYYRYCINNGITPKYTDPKLSKEDTFEKLKAIGPNYTWGNNQLT